MALKTKQINLDTKIKYVPVTENLGRAEFLFCPVFKYGKMRKLFIFRLQQKNREHYCLDLEKIGLKNTTTFDITSWSHKKDLPVIWRNFWCKEHKTISFEVYVPNNTDTIEFAYHFGDSLTIRFIKGKELR